MTTQNTLLGGQVSLHQPAVGYRAGLDAVLLGASLPLAPPHKKSNTPENILDIGCGAGAAFLVAAFHHPHHHFVGVELQRAYLDIAQINLTHNNLNGRVTLLEDDVLNPSAALKSLTFDQVMMNPPYFDLDKSNASPSLLKARANHQQSAHLQDWLLQGLKRLKSHGIITVILPATKLVDALNVLQNQVGQLKIFPIWSKEGQEAKRIILQGRKNTNTPLSLRSGLIIHQQSGEYTAAAQKVLKGTAPLII